MSKENALILILALILLITIVITIFSTFDKVDEERCKQMPFSEMVEHKECDKYWKNIE